MIKQFQTFFISIAAAFALMVGGLLSGTLFTAAKDPLWLHIDKLKQSKFVMLEECVDSLQYLYNFIQNNETVTGLKDDFGAFKIMNKPFLPTMEFCKFDKYCRQLHEKKRMTLGSVTGSSTSTPAVRLVHFLATNAACEMEVVCAPMFDLELHKEFIGINDENGTFRKGKLLKMWDECRKNPTKKYVCTLSGLDKINPETFFVPALWQKLGDERVTVVLGKDTITIPPNFYLFSVVHTGVSSLIELNNEYFKPLGDLHYVKNHK